MAHAPRLLAFLQLVVCTTGVGGSPHSVEDLARHFDSRRCRRALHQLRARDSAWERICAPPSDLCRFLDHVGAQVGMRRVPRAA